MEQIKIIGVVKEVTYRKRRTSESFLEKCDFTLESGEKIICVGFYPTVRKSFKVKIVGKWSESGKSIIAESVDRVNNQSQLDKYYNDNNDKEVEKNE
jgi:hypothetical protein